MNARTWIDQLLALTTMALILGTGLVLAAQGPGRADLAAFPTDRERQPLWVPGTDVPMSTYTAAHREPLLAPPR